MMLKVSNGKAVNLNKVNYITVWKRGASSYDRYYAVGVKFDNGVFETVSTWSTELEAQAELNRLLQEARR